MKIKQQNSLAFEKSPYLLQHAGNPVDADLSFHRILDLPLVSCNGT
jgi:hypothetical protein